MPGVVSTLSRIPPATDKVAAEVQVTPALVGKVVGCLFLLTMGLYYLYSGKENQSVPRMLLGAVLVLGAFLVFF
ncbi:MAG: hypothetical protein HY748_14350 [Elusimicrobia bacterium]|nr:hypothetical protein [Elusimicrobiota bacterium]